MIVIILLCIIFVLLFSTIQSLILLKQGRDLKSVAKEKLDSIKNSNGVQKWVLEKQIKLKRMGADMFVKDGILVSQWYLYKALFAVLLGGISYIVLELILKKDYGALIAILIGCVSFFFLDFYLSLENKQSNEEMMADICEMSRCVLYGKRGGQYIIDAI